MTEKGIKRVEKTKLGQKGMKLFHSSSRIAYKFQILILRLMSHQFRYSVIGEMSYRFRCIYCISSKMMTHFIKNFIKLRFTTQDQDLSGFLKEYLVLVSPKLLTLKSPSMPSNAFIEILQSPCKAGNPLATLDIFHPCPLSSPTVGPLP